MEWMRRGLALGLVALIGLGSAALSAEEPEPGIEEIRNRLRAAAGIRDVPTRDEDLPMVAVTALPDDTHERLALDLTGDLDAVAVLQRIQPLLKPGRQFYVPRMLLSPALSDPRMEPLALGDPYPTLWTLASVVTGVEKAEVGRVVRNIQRLNGILDPGRLTKGTRILVPRSLLKTDSEESSVVQEDAPAREEGQPQDRIEPKARSVSRSRPSARIVTRKEYRVTDLRGLDRRRGKFSERLRRALTQKELKECRTGRGDVNLVVIHTTEHGVGAFENTAAYIHRKRLANYLIGPDGAVYQIVPEEYRSFGCGDSLWEGKYNVDLEAINVEIFANTAPGEYEGSISDAQYEGLKALVADIQARRPAIHDGRVLTHRMVSVSFKSGTRSRKGDPYQFDWAGAGLPDNSQAIDQDVLLGRTKLCTDERYADRVTPGQEAAARMATKL